MSEATVSTKGWVVIPAALRRKYDLTPGTRVHVFDYGGVVSLVPVEHDPVAASAGVVKGKTSLTRAIVKEHEKERGARTTSRPSRKKAS